MKRHQMTKYHIQALKRFFKLSKGTFDNLKKIKVEKIPFVLDGKKVYQVTAKTRIKLLEKLKDGRQWKKDSRTTWSDFKEV